MKVGFIAAAILAATCAAICRPVAADHKDSDK